MKNKTACFFVDPQNGFTEYCPEELPVPGGHTIVPALNAMASLASMKICSRDAHAPNAAWINPDRSMMGKPTGLPDAPLYWPSHCIVGTKGFELIEGLPPIESFCYVVNKGLDPTHHPFGAVYWGQDKKSTGVVEVLRDRGMTRVLVGGLAYDFCVRDTAIQLAEAGFEVIVVSEATKAISAETAQAATEQMKNAGVMIVETLSQISEEY